MSNTCIYVHYTHSAGAYKGLLMYIYIYFKKEPAYCTFRVFLISGSLFTGSASFSAAQMREKDEASPMGAPHGLGSPLKSVNTD